jgi:hypothetical protein
MLGLYDSLIKAQYYRDQAQHMRLSASQDQNPETHAALLSLAENYDRLHAKLLEQARLQQSQP